MGGRGERIAETEGGDILLSGEFVKIASLEAS